MHLKRFLADWDFEHQPPFPAPVEKTHQERVAVIGGGPAGLACAHDLAKLGYPVTLFEAAAKLGGMLRACVPQFRLPEAYLDRDIEYLLWPGFEVRTNAALGRDFTLEQLEAEGYRAVFLATGAHKPKRLPIPGHDLEGIGFNIDFLQKARAGEPPDLHGRLLVIGGGNVAMDVARTARRLGAGKVTMACLESRQSMPAHAWEIQQALDEGIEIVNDVTFKRFLGDDGRVTGVEAKRIRSMAFDTDGRLTVDEIAGSDFAIAADRVVVAIGQTPDLSFLDPKNQIRVRRGMVEVDPETLATGHPGVFAGGDVIAEEPQLRIFAGGDVVTGTAFVVDAVAAGHKAAGIHSPLPGRRAVAGARHPTRAATADTRRGAAQAPSGRNRAPTPRGDSRTARRRAAARLCGDRPRVHRGNGSGRGEPMSELRFVLGMPAMRGRLPGARHQPPAAPAGTPECQRWRGDPRPGRGNV